MPIGMIPHGIMDLRTVGAGGSGGQRMEAQTTPFDFGGTVSRGAFNNRRKELARLKGNMAGGINTILISPRRWGKSSLVEQAALELRIERKKARVAILDTFTCGTFEEFLENLTRAVLEAASNGWEEQVRRAKTFFKAIMPKITIGTVLEGEGSFGFDWKEARKHAGDILDMAERVAKAKKPRLVICVDEFQNLKDWHDDLRMQKLMRAHCQRHKHVTNVLYGSKRHMMAGLFDSSVMPFYRIGDLLWLERISLEHWTTFIQERFKSTGKSIAPELAAALASTMKCHSWYMQQMAHFTWEGTRKKADRGSLDHSLELVLDANTPFYQLTCERISLTGINLLKAVANGETKLTSMNVMHGYRPGTPRNVQKALETL